MDCDDDWLRDMIDNEMGDFLGYSEFDILTPAAIESPSPEAHTAVLKTLIAQQTRINAVRNWKCATRCRLSPLVQQRLNAQLAQLQRTPSTPPPASASASARSLSPPLSPALVLSSGDSLGHRRTAHGCRMVTNSRGGVEFLCDSFPSHFALATTSVVFSTAKLHNGDRSLRSSIGFKSDLEGEPIEKKPVVRGCIYYVRGEHTVEQAKKLVITHAAAVLFQAYVKIMVRLRPACVRAGKLGADYTESAFDRRSPTPSVTPGIPSMPRGTKLGAVLNVAATACDMVRTLCKDFDVPVPTARMTAELPLRKRPRTIKAMQANKRRCTAAPLARNSEQEDDGSDDDGSDDGSDDDGSDDGSDDDGSDDDGSDDDGSDDDGSDDDDTKRSGVTGDCSSSSSSEESESDSGDEEEEEDEVKPIPQSPADEACGICVGERMATIQMGCQRHSCCDVCVKNLWKTAGLHHVGIRCPFCRDIGTGLINKSTKTAYQLPNYQLRMTTPRNYAEKEEDDESGTM